MAGLRFDRCVLVQWGLVVERRVLGRSKPCNDLLNGETQAA